jgi:gamma-butyrobetaine dioxygenase
MSRVIEEIVELFSLHGHAAYLGEPVSQAEHALQAASLAEREGAPPALIAAALLHDVGHLLDARAADPATTDLDLGHEATGARWLAAHFPPAVVRPVELHVAAKRYLCAAEPAYFARLSPASVASLRLQGGPMSQEEAEAFRRDPFAPDAVRVRRWDEEAKVAGLRTPSVGHFRAYLASALTG